MPTSNNLLKSKKNTLHIFIASSVGIFLLAIGYIVYLDYGGNTEQGTTQEGITDTNRLQNNLPPILQLEGKIRTQGGVIGFKPTGGDFFNELAVELSVESVLKSIKGEPISADIYYTLDGADPSKENGKKYIPGTYIYLKAPQEATIKARLISKIGNAYAGKIYSQEYTIKPEPVLSQVKITADNGVTENKSGNSLPQVKKQIADENENIITDFNLLDLQTREEIADYTKRIKLDIADIVSIKDNEFKFKISISTNGKGRVLDISGFTIEPENKKADIKFQLDEKIQGIPFSAPTKDGKNVGIQIWLRSYKIAKYNDKIIIEKYI